jgi:hypothetical protein
MLDGAAADDAVATGVVADESDVAADDVLPLEQPIAATATSSSTGAADIRDRVKLKPVFVM